MIVAKRDSAEDRKRQKTEARIGLASNVLGIAAGTAALAGTAQNPALRDPSVANAGPVTRRLLHRNPSARLTPLGRRLVRGGAAGAVALQAANLGGDIVANRVLSREAKKGDPMKKSIEQSLVSKSSEVRVTGRGVNIAKAEKFTDEEHRAYAEQEKKVRAVNRRVGRVQGATALGLTGAAAGGWSGALAAHIADRRGASRHPLAIGTAAGAALGGLGGAILGGKAGANAGDRRAQRFMADPNVKYLAMSGRRELARREKAVAKAEKFTDEDHRAYERDTKEVLDANRRRGRVQGGVSGSVAGGFLGYAAGAGLHNMQVGRYNDNLWNGRNVMGLKKPRRGRVAVITGAGGLAGAALGSVAGGRAQEDRAKRFMADSNVKYLTMSGRRELERRKNVVEKRYYDPEMDRQRRLGMYSGLGLGGGAGLIALGAKDIRPAKRMVEDGRVVRGLAMPKGKAAAARLALMGGGLLATGGGLVAYKRSNSRANDPWD